MNRSVILCIFASASAPLGLAGDLDPPPGPVAPTMKTLDEVEPSTPIDSLPGDSNTMHVITEPGAYHLTENLMSPGTGVSAIDANADGVTIDLNGFSIIGNGSETEEAVQLDVSCEVRNGTIRNWGDTGVQFLSSGAVRGVRFDNTSTAIDASTGVLIESCVFRICEPLTLSGDAMIRGCTFRDMDEVIDGVGAPNVSIIDTTISGQNTAGTGGVIVLGDDARLSNVTISDESKSALLADDNASVIGCNFSGNGQSSNDGVNLGDHAVIRDTVISYYGGDAIDVNFAAVVRGNMIVDNDGRGIVVNNAGHIEANVVRENGPIGVEVSGDNVVVNNTLDGNRILVTGTDNTIDSNSVTDVANSIEVTSGGNRVTRNSVTSDIVAVSGNLVGTVRTMSNFSSAGPWDNFEP